MTVDDLNEMWKADPEEFLRLVVSHSMKIFTENCLSEFSAMYKLEYINSHTMLIQINSKDVKTETELILN